MRNSNLPSAEWLKCKLFKYNDETKSTAEAGIPFKGKQTSVADLVAFQTKKGATEDLSHPLTGIDSKDIKFEIYTISRLQFDTYDEIEVQVENKVLRYTLDSVSTLMDSVYVLRNMRTGKTTFPKVLRLK